MTFKEYRARAMRHCSVAGPNNEQLELLGDSVLNLAITLILISMYPGADEGELTKRRANLVCTETLVEIAYQLRLDKRLVVGPKARRRKTNQALADAVEALIGAHYLGKGFESAEQFIRSNWGNKRFRAPIKVGSTTRLQELMQGQGLGLPEYTIQSNGPQESQQFTACVAVNGRKAFGTGSSKQLARVAAAEKMLEMLS